MHETVIIIRTLVQLSTYIALLFLPYWDAAADGGGGGVGGSKKKNPKKTRAVLICIEKVR